MRKFIFSSRSRCRAFVRRLFACAVCVVGTFGVLRCEEPAVDLTVYLSPVKMVQTQSCERILNTDAWTGFYLSRVQKLDQRHLCAESPSRLMTQMARTFGKTTCSSNDLLNLAFFNLQGVWGQFKLAENLRPTAADSFLTFVSDFQPEETAGLTEALLGELGFLPESAAANLPAQFCRADGSALYFDRISPLPFAEDRSAFFIGKSPEALTRQKGEFLTAEQVKAALGNQDRVFFLLSLQRGGLDKIAAYFSALPSDSSLAPFAAGLTELANQTDSVWLSIQESRGVSTATLTVFGKESASAADLYRLFDSARAMFRTWRQGRDLAVWQDLALDIFDRSELIQEDERFYLIFKLTDEEIFQKIGLCFQSCPQKE